MKRRKNHMKRKLTMLMALILGACSAERVPDIKAHAVETFSANGFKIIGYQGYQWGLLDNYGGRVWYTLEKDGIVYEACLTKWGDEYHIYSLKALNAVSTSKK
jgi:hypothetical protein